MAGWGGNFKSMPRKLRLEYRGAIYHAMNRGDRREDIFRDDEDRKVFLATLGEACQKTRWQVHAFCLMRNHFHLVVETPEANLVAGGDDDESGVDCGASADGQLELRLQPAQEGKKCKQ